MASVGGMLRFTATFVGLAVLAVGLTLFVKNRQSAIDTAIEWARLQPPPVSSLRVNVDTSGSMFSREIQLSFRADRDQLHRWLLESDGISDAKVSTKGSVTLYDIRPGGGAQFAEVRVDESTGHVIVRTYWS